VWHTPCLFLCWCLSLYNKTFEESQVTHECHSVEALSILQVWGSIYSFHKSKWHHFPPSFRSRRRTSLLDFEVWSLKLPWRHNTRWPICDAPFPNIHKKKLDTIWICWSEEDTVQISKICKVVRRLGGRLCHVMYKQI
jgi:hypothetical protein